jgi:hypothetical protein
MFSLLIDLNKCWNLCNLFTDPQLVALIQIKNILAPGVADPHGTWRNCKLDITKCSSNQLATMQGEHFFLSWFVSHLNLMISIFCFCHYLMHIMLYEAKTRHWHIDSGNNFDKIVVLNVTRSVSVVGLSPTWTLSIWPISATKCDLTLMHEWIVFQVLGQIS